MKTIVCSCGEVLTSHTNKDYIICPKCNKVHYIVSKQQLDEIAYTIYKENPFGEISESEIYRIISKSFIKEPSIDILYKLKESHIQETSTYGLSSTDTNLYNMSFYKLKNNKIKRKIKMKLV